MGNSDRSSINQELSNYLSSKKRQSGRFANLSLGKGDEAKKDFEQRNVEVIEDKKGTDFSKIISKLTDLFKKEEKPEQKEEEAEEPEQEVAQQQPTESEQEELQKLPKKGGPVKRFLKKIGIVGEDVDKQFINEYEDEVESLDEDVHEIKEEMKTVAKISTQLMGKLPKEELENFKNSEQFSRFKEILQKYNLIK